MADAILSDNFDPVPGVKYEDEKVEIPQEPAKEPEKAPETPVNPAPPEPAKVEEPAKPEAQPETKVERPKKAGPIAKLLEDRHTLETENAELKRKLEQASQQPASPQSTADVKQLSEEYGIDETLLQKIVDTARSTVKPELPKEVQDLLEERKAEKTQAEELAAFNKRVDSLAKTLPNESFADPKVKEKLLALAYSTEKAPDGEPYYQKELSELYFAYIKPEIEPGQSSAETSQGGTQTTKVVDFEEIFNRDDPKEIEAMDSPTFTKYNTWVRENKESKTPLRRSG